MKPYKLKHKPTGLYYQPKTHRSSNLSKKGKIYQTKNNILSIGFYADGKSRKTLTVYVYGNSHIYKQYKEKFDWKESYNYNEYIAETDIEDWTKEEL